MPDAIRRQLRQIQKQDRPFDILAMIGAISRMLNSIDAFESDMAFQLQYAQGIDLKTKDEAQYLDNYARVLAVMSILTHGSVVSESLLARCVEYAYKAQINTLSDYETGWRPCQDCVVRNEICGIPAAQDVMAYMLQLKHGAHDVSGRVQSFLATAKDYYKGATAADKAVSEARLETANIADKWIGSTLSSMNPAINEMTELAKNWQTAPGTQIVEVYATMLALSAFTDGISMWLSDTITALPFA